MPGGELARRSRGGRGSVGPADDAVEPGGDGAAPCVGGSSGGCREVAHRLITSITLDSAATAGAAKQARGREDGPGSSRSLEQQQGGLLGGKRARAAGRHALALACLLGLLGTAAASPGDRSWHFQRCTAQCGRTGCASLAPVPAAGSSTGSGLPASRQCSPLCGIGGGGSSGGIGGSPDGAQQPVPLALRLWRWDCASDCSYLCMWQLESSRRQAGAAPQKYHGKWPFVRLAGMQEPASMLFSLLNLAAHAHCLARFRRLCGSLWAQHGRQQGKRGGAGGTVASAENGVAGCAACSNGSPGNGSACAVHAAAAEAPSTYPYAWLWEGYMLLSINAWLWSAVFHGRDTRLTERFDYLSAALLIFYNLFLSVVRVCQLRSPAALATVAAPLLIFLAAHFRYMLLVLFDYGYHVKVCIAAGAAQSLLWLAWAVAAPRRSPGRASLLAFILLLNACMALEILDFPPLLSVLDAHSLWHAATAPLVYLFYHFIRADASSWRCAAKAKHI